MRWASFLCIGLLGCAQMSPPASTPASDPEPASPVSDPAPSSPPALSPPAPVASDPPSATSPGTDLSTLTLKQVLRVVMVHKGAVRACYETGAATDRTLKGMVVLAWRILPDGSVRAGTITKSTLNNSRVEGCMLRELSGWRFPPAETPTIVPSFPFTFAL